MRQVSDGGRRDKWRVDVQYLGDPGALLQGGMIASTIYTSGELTAVSCPSGLGNAANAKRPGHRARRGGHRELVLGIVP